MAFIKNIFLNVLSGASFTIAALLVAVAYVVSIPVLN